MTKQLVLMVDDELDNRVMMRYFLESWGYEVELAANGKEALEKVAAQRPVLVLLDLEMPVMDGFETCNALKSDPDTENIPVIMFTGLEATADKVKGIKKGADDYVVKTVDPEEIQARIEMILRRSQRFERQPQADSGNGSGAVLSGSLEDKSFPEAFQLAMAYGQSGTLEINNDGEVAKVYLVDGDVVHAECRDLEGQDAFYELALWNKGQFAYKVGDSTPKRTIEANGQSLLMEATRRMDEWNLISSKIQSLDVVPHRATSGAGETIRLTKTDWRLLSHVDGKKTLRQISEELSTDPYEAGRTLFGLLSAGVVSFEADKLERDSFFDAVPELRDEPVGNEPFEISAVQWKLLAYIDGVRDLGALTHLVGLAPRKMAAELKELAEKGFIRVNKSRAKSEGPGASATAPPSEAENSGGSVEAFQPRIRAVGLD